MDLSGIFTAAARLIWKHKALWLLGLLVALGAEYGGPGMPMVPPLGGADLSDVPWGEVGAIPAWVWPTVMGVAAWGIVLTVILLFIGLIARGGLIASVEQIERDGTFSMGSAWKVGATRVWRMLGMVLALYLPAIAVVAAATLLGLVALAGAAGQDMAMLQLRDLMVTIVPVIAALACLLTVYGLVAGGLEVLAERAIILDELAVKDSLLKAWHVFMSHLGQIILVALVLFAIDLGVSLIIGFGAATVMLPFVFGAVAAFESQTIATGLGLIGAGVLAAIAIGLSVSAVFTSYVSTVWTLVYRQLLVAVKPTAQTPAALPA